MTMMSVSTAGLSRTATLFSGPVGLEEYGLWELSVVVLFTTAAAPLARVLCMLAVLIGLRLPHPPREIRAIYGWVEHLRPWSMVEIYLLGVFVAYVRLSSLVHIDLGTALYALAALMVTMVAADVALDQQAVWEAMERRLPRQPSRERTAGALGARLWRMGCDTCGLVSRARPGAACPRCGYALRHRKPNSTSAVRFSASGRASGSHRVCRSTASQRTHTAREAGSMAGSTWTCPQSGHSRSRGAVTDGSASAWGARSAADSARAAIRWSPWRRRGGTHGLEGSAAGWQEKGRGP
jgi:hypothetical protein